MYKIEIRTPNLLIGSFTGSQIQKSIYQLANCAVFIAQNKEFEDLKTIKQALKKDLDVQVQIDGETVLSGYIAAVDSGYFNKKPSLQVKINTYAGRMVGASIGKNIFFTAQSAAEIVKQVISGFDVKFINQSQSNIVLPSYALSATDKVEDVLTDLARLSDTLIYSADDGSLIMADKCRDKYTSSALITGENIIDIFKNDNLYQAFSDVVLHSQLPLNDDVSLEKIIDSQQAGTSAGSKRQMHKTVNIANSARLAAEIAELEYDCYDLQVVGSSFRTTDDKFYAINTALKVKDNWLELNDSFLITDFSLSSNAAGCRACLNLEKM